MKIKQTKTKESVIQDFVPKEKLKTKASSTEQKFLKAENMDQTDYILEIKYLRILD